LTLVAEISHTSTRQGVFKRADAERRNVVHELAVEEFEDGSATLIFPTAEIRER
jgi:hypothetical protein